MKLGRYTLLFALLGSFGAFSCAQSESENWEDIEQESLDLWMRQHRAEGLANGTIEYLEEGMYFERLKPAQNGTKPETGDWIQLNYRGTDLRGNVFVTLYKEEAKKEGTFLDYAHYIPHFMPFATYTSETNTYTTLTEGEWLALSKMTEGDSVRIYLPSHLAYLSSGKTFYSTSNYRYPGSMMTVSGNIPVIIDLFLEKVIEDPTHAEREQVVEKATEWGIGKGDYLSDYFYLERVEEDLTELTVMENDAVYIEFVGRFLDGFLYETNVESVAREEWKSTSLYSPKVFHNRPSYTSSDYLARPIVEMFTKTLEEENGQNGLRYNSLYRIVFSSDYGYGSTEQAPTTTKAVVYPYTPFMYEIRTMPSDYNTSDDDNDDDDDD